MAEVQLTQASDVELSERTRGSGFFWGDGNNGVAHADHPVCAKCPLETLEKERCDFPCAFLRIPIRVDTARVGVRNKCYRVLPWVESKSLSQSHRLGDLAFWSKLPGTAFLLWFNYYVWEWDISKW